MVDYEALIQELEEAGIDEVRARLLNNQYAKISPKRDIAQDWLNRKEMEHTRQRQAQADATAERAAAATQEQAKQAQRANRIAATALLIAIAAAIMSVIALAKKIT
jgi:hypothetical protein